jgi:hypothetical protein
MAYQRTDTDVLIRLRDGVMIPQDERNTDYQEYLEWFNAKEENEPLPHVEPEPIVLTPEEKLSNAGLSVDELKALLDGGSSSAT